MKLANCCMAAAFVALSMPAHAIVVGGAITGGTAFTQGGAFVTLGVPFVAPITGDASVGNNTFQTPNVYAFNEDQNILISSTIQVNIGNNPMAGQTVASHYVFFDPRNITRAIGYVDFDAPIYGIATETPDLLASDFLANSGVTYLNPGARGLEGNDSVSIDSANPYRMLFDFTASTPGDYVRVFTQESPGAVIPLPAAGWLLLSGLGVLAGVRRFS